MKILITGCCGFIGTNLSLFTMRNTTHKIVGVDSNPFKENLDELQKFSNFEFLNLDIEDIDVSLLGKIDKIVHLAAIAGVRKSIEDPVYYVKNNVVKFVHLLEESKKNGNIDMIYASSSSVYGENEKIPYEEDDTILKLRSSYACSKKCMEVYARYYYDVFDLNSIGLRFFTVYGERGRKDMAPYIFTKNIFDEKEITQYGNGETMRDYTYIGDIVDGIFSIIEGKGKPGNIYNLGCGNPIKLKDFIKVVEKVTGKKAKIRVEKVKVGDVPKTYASIEKANKDLGFFPKVKLEEGIRRLLTSLITPKE
jgi:UDP-glucuronate 4-epimerase